MYFVYIIQTSNNKFYIGHSNNPNRREFEHRFHPYGAKFLKDNKTDFQIVYTEPFSTRSEAMKREKHLKGWTRAKKLGEVQDFRIWSARAASCAEVAIATECRALSLSLGVKLASHTQKRRQGDCLRTSIFSPKGRQTLPDPSTSSG